MTNAPYRDDLNKIVVLNPKGGCGKTTLSTNLASYFALRGPSPTLIDCDPKGYSERWLERRSPDSCSIKGIASEEFVRHGNRLWPFRTPKDAGAIIIDTPAALDRRDISELTRDADCMLVPVLPSTFDVQVTTKFIAELLLLTDFDVPFQNYVHAAANGLGIYEMPHYSVRQDIEQMNLIIDWLDQQLMRTLEPNRMSPVNLLPRLFAS
jgi:chromosome partitioning protein